MKALQLRDVHKRFHDHLALRGVDLSIEPGEVVCLLGASGSGKTTLLRLVAGLEHLDRGSIELGGRPVDGPGMAPVPPERRGLGMVFQDYALWPHLSALDNVALALRARAPRGAAVDAQARDMLRRVGLDAMQQRRPHELSGGQQQRVALARALAVRPQLLLCDEPLSNLDAGLREELRELIGDVVRAYGLSALYITHDHREAFALGDRVGILDEGRLLQIDAPRRLLAQACCEQVASFLHALGPWPLRQVDDAWHAPWGRLPADCAAPGPAGWPARLYLPPAAVRLAGPAGADNGVPVEAQVLGCLSTPQGIEIAAQLHGVAVRLGSHAWHAPGDRVGLCVDLRQALIYRDATPVDGARAAHNMKPEQRAA